MALVGGSMALPGWSDGRLGCSMVRAVLTDPKDADRIERLLGLSRGYLSRLRTGRKIPSEPLVAILALIHQQPSVLKRVEAMWERPAA